MGDANLPPGTWDGDPRAPWNQPEPWEGHICFQCKHFWHAIDATTDVCCHPDNWPEAHGARSVDKACEGFEEIGT